MDDFQISKREQGQPLPPIQQDLLGSLIDLEIRTAMLEAGVNPNAL